MLGHSLVEGAASPVPRAAVWLCSSSSRSAQRCWPLCYVSRGKDVARGCGGFQTAWPEKRGQSCNLAGLRSLAGRELQGCSAMDRKAKIDGLLLKQMIIKLYPKICIPQVCFTFLYCDLSSLLPKKKGFSFFFTVLPCQAKSLFSWKLIDRLLTLIFVRAILEMFYFIISQLRTVVTLCYKVANYSVSDLQCAVPAVQFVRVSENF